MAIVFTPAALPDADLPAVSAAAPRPPAIRLTLAAGTSNWGPHVTYGHGHAWAQMVNQANDWLRPVNRSRRVTVVGADDIELAWNGPRASKRWVLGYESVAGWPYLDYG